MIEVIQVLFVFMINFIGCFSSSTLLFMQLTYLKTSNETNYEDCVECLKLYLMATNLDLPLREEEPLIDNNSFIAQRAQHKKMDTLK